MIEARQLTKFFGQSKVVDNVSFSVRKGEVLGFLGPNAAGKSTTMRMIVGYLPPSAGTALIGGSDVTTDSLAARKKIGYLPENAPAYQDMSVTAFLDFVARIRGFSGAEKKRAIDATIEKCFLTEVRRQNVGTLSKGFKQRVCFAQSILHDPEYLILDEPTDGLDPNQKHEVRSMIRAMGREKAIILSTHILEEVDAVCTRAIVIAKGVIVADDTPEGLRRMSAVHGCVNFTVPKASENEALSAIRSLEGVIKVEVLDRAGADVVLRAYPAPGEAALADGVVKRLAQSGVALSALDTEKGRLDEVFRRITQR